MIYKVRRIEGHKTAMIMSAVMALFSLIAILPFTGLFSLLPLGHGGRTGGMFSWLFLLFPVIYFCIGYITLRIMIFIYNILANNMEGITLELEDTGSGDTIGSD